LRKRKEEGKEGRREGVILKTVSGKKERKNNFTK